MKLYYVIASLLICPSLHSMQNSPKEKRKALQHKLNLLRTVFLQKGILTQKQVQKKEITVKEILATYQQELPAPTAKKENYIFSRIQHFKNILEEINKSKNPSSPDIRESTALRYGSQYADKQLKKLKNQIKILEKHKQKAQKILGLNNEENVTPQQSNLQRQKWINRYKIVFNQIQTTSYLDQCKARQKFINLYNEALYLLLQITDNYEQEKNLPNKNLESVAPHWQQELNEISARRDILLGHTSIDQTPQTELEQSTLGLQNLFNEKQNSGLLNKLFGWMAFWKK